MGVLKDWWRTATGRRAPRFRPPPEARFTKIGTDYRGAPQTTTPRYRAPNPYVGFDGASARTSPTRGRRTGTMPPWGSPSGPDPRERKEHGKAAAVATAPRSQAPVTPAPSPSHSASRPSAARNRAIAVLVVVTAVVIVVAIGAAIALITDDSSDNGLPDAGDLEEVWELESDDVTGDWRAFDSVDGTLPGSVLSTSTGWLVLQEASTVDAVLASVDPATGEVQWHTPMPEGRCTQAGADAALVCLTRDDPGAAFRLVTLDPATGDVLGSPVTTTLTHVPVVLVGLGEGLLTLSVTGSLAALDLDGTMRWEEPLNLPDLDTTYLQPDIARYPDAVVLYLGSYVGTVHATLDGFTTHVCNDVAATPEAWLCVDVDRDEAIGRTPAGETLWTGDWQDYYLVDTYQRIAPVIITDNWDGTISGVDPLTGEHGAPIRVGDGSDNLSFLGDASYPVVTTDSAVALLDEGLTEVLWRTDITDEYLNIAVGGVVNGTIVMDAEHSYGFDPATGEVLWEHNSVGYEVLLLDDVLITISGSALTRYDV